MAAQCATESLDNPLWQFAQAFYQNNGVEEALLELQDDHHADILLLLAALWLAADWREWPAGVKEPFTEYLAWREHVIWPLRGVRRTLPEERQRNARQAQPADFRSRIKALELEAEQMGLAGLSGLLEPLAVPHDLTSEPDARALRQLARNNVQDAMQLDDIRVSSGQARSAVHTLLLALDEYLASIPRQGQLWPDNL